MATTFVVSDTHFGHRLMIRLRPWDTLEEHDQALVQNWNKTVGPKDTIYHLGDFCMNRKYIQTAKVLNGRKILIRGNHDVFHAREYMDAGFEDIRGCHQLAGMILTHIPIHPMSVTRYGKNLHGHLHTGTVQDDNRYKCVSIEQTNWRPISLEEIRSDW